MPQSPTRSSIVLADGRTLSYIEFGDADGAPVLHHHGGLVSATDIEPGDAVARELGVRWISFDRPGLVGSSPSPGRTLLQGAEDAEQLLDQLGVADVRLTGWSMGGPYALATAHRLDERVRCSAIVAGNLPLDDPGTLDELNTMDHRLTAMAQRHAGELRMEARMLGAIARCSPGLWAREAAAHEGAEDERAVHESAAVLAASAHEATEHPDAVVEEYRAWALPWGFNAADVGTPVDVWQGTDDHLIPPDWSRRLASALPAGSLHMVEGAGHFLLLEHAHEVLSTLLADA